MINIGNMQIIIGVNIANIKKCISKYQIYSFWIIQEIICKLTIYKIIP